MVSAMIVPQRRAASRRVMRGLGRALLARRATRGTSAAVRAAALFLSRDCQEESDDLSPLLSFPFRLRFFVPLVVSRVFFVFFSWNAVTAAADVEYRDECRWQ
jgi:hypothetical protein